MAAADAEAAALHGVVCTQEILPREVICAVPNKVIISTETARNSEIAQIFRKHEDLFVVHPERDHLVLVLFLMYERSKGQYSFWYPYFGSA